MFRLCLALVLVASALGLEIEGKPKAPPKSAHHDADTAKIPGQSTHNLVGSKKLPDLRKYTYADFVRDFKRSVTPGTPEFKQREAIFQQNMQKIMDHHAGPQKAWSKGINKFMDYTSEEFSKLLGHKGQRKLRAGSFMQTRSNTTGPIALPAFHDWRPKLKESSTFSRDQGACGSCWAFAAIQALEGHVEIKHGKADKLSAQMLVSCMPNELHCGGKGGCDGATADMAFQYIQENGIPSESQWPYTSFSGRNGVCNPALKEQRHINIERWELLPTNEDAPIAQALYEHGPVVVSVDGSPWSLYQSGIFAGCGKDAIINHAVVAEGFGEEVSPMTKQLHKYYLIKNSWGSDWGENGYIRLERFEDSRAHCGIDNKPEEGNGCDGGPSEIEVCGMCGVTSDSAFPVNPTYATTSSLTQVTGKDMLQKGFKDLISRS